MRDIVLGEQAARSHNVFIRDLVLVQWSRCDMQAFVAYFGDLHNAAEFSRQSAALQLLWLDSFGGIGSTW